MPASIEELAYAEAVRGIEEQSNVLTNLQMRAGTLLAATSLATSFLSGRAIGDGFEIASSAAVVFFVASSLLTVGVLWPRHRWRFVLSPSVLLSAPHDEQPADASARAHREVALQLEEMYDANRAALAGLFRIFRGATACLILEVVAWIAALV